MKTTTPFSTAPWSSFIWALFDGLLIGVIGFLGTGHNERHLWLWPVLGFAAGASSGFRRLDRPWMWPAYVAGGTLMGCLLAMIPGWLAGATAYNLWPIVLVFIGVLTFPAIFVGSLIANGIRRLVKRP